MKTLMLSKVRAGTLVWRRRLNDLKSHEIVDRVQREKIAAIRDGSLQSMIYREDKTANPPCVFVTFAQHQRRPALPQLPEFFTMVGLVEMQARRGISLGVHRIHLLLPISSTTKKSTSFVAYDLPYDPTYAKLIALKIQRLLRRKGFNQARCPVLHKTIDGVKILLIRAESGPI